MYHGKIQPLKICKLNQVQIHPPPAVETIVTPKNDRNVPKRKSSDSTSTFLSLSVDNERESKRLRPESSYGCISSRVTVGAPEDDSTRSQFKLHTGPQSENDKRIEQMVLREK